MSGLKGFFIGGHYQQGHQVFKSDPSGKKHGFPSERGNQPPSENQCFIGSNPREISMKLASLDSEASRS
jgi:hypothetical protein